jgi:ribosomal protein L7/L12
MSIDGVTIALVLLLILVLLTLVARGVARSRSNPVRPFVSESEPPSGQTNLTTEVQQVARSRGMIAAIQLYRQRTGVGLVEAKYTVESIMRGGRGMPARILASTSDQDIDDLIQKGKKIEAIKRYRYQTGASLRDAKAAVDARSAELGV